MVYHTSGQGTTQAQYESIAHHAFDGSIIPTPTGRTGYVIAASNATATEKAQADYLCDGTADDVQINAAITYLSASGGKVVLSEGTFKLAAAIVMLDYVTLEMNNSIIRPQGNFAAISITNKNYWGITGGGWIITYADVGTPTTNASAIGIYVNGSSNCNGFVIENGYINYGYRGIQLEGICWNYSVNNVYVQLTQNDGYYVHCGMGGATNANFNDCEATQTGADLAGGSAFYGYGVSGLNINGAGLQTNASAGAGSAIYVESCVARLTCVDGEGCYPVVNNGVFNFVASQVTMNSCYTYGNSVTATNSYVIYMYGGTLVCNGFQTQADVGTNSNNALIKLDYGATAVFNGGSITPPTNAVYWLSYDAVTPQNVRGLANVLGTGEVRTLQYALTGGALNAVISEDNPFALPVRVMSVDLQITAQSSASGKLDVGIGSSATTDYTDFFSHQPTDLGTSYPYFRNSLKTTTYGVQVNPVYWNSGSGNRYLNFYNYAATRNLAAIATVTVMGD